MPRLAERARSESWTHVEFLAACPQREVAARFPARKALEEFDFESRRRSDATPSPRMADSVRGLASRQRCHDRLKP